MLLPTLTRYPKCRRRAPQSVVTVKGEDVELDLTTLAGGP
jgi:hypothetical protein